MKATKKISAAAAVAKIDTANMTAKQKRIMNNIAQSSIKFDEKYDHVEYFYSTAEAYIKAVAERRHIATVHSVAPSGGSRTVTLKILEKSKGNKEFSGIYMNFFVHQLLNQRRNKAGELVLTGGGMDMVWDLNYRVINALTRLGFITKKRGAELAQIAPHNI